jgi:tetratricopeptide (TPR) repeat protein
MRTSSVGQPAESPAYQAFFAQLTLCCSRAAPDVTPLMHETVFQQLILDVMGTEDPAEFRRFKRLLFQGMVHFRQVKEGNLPVGFAGLCDLQVTVGGLPAAIRPLAEAMLLPMLAYYHFRTGDYDAARACNGQAVLVSSSLQEAYPILHLHQIQQQFNLSRIDLAQHRYADALHTIKALIDYLAGGAMPTLSGTWTPALRAALTPALADHQLLDILNELAFLALRRTDLEPTIARTVLADAGRLLADAPLITPSPAAAILTWWRFYQPQARGLLAGRLAHIGTLIGQYPADYDQIKLLLLGRLHATVTQAGEVRPDEARPDELRLIRRFVNTRLQLSYRLQRHIRSIRNGQITA